MSTLASLQRQTTASRSQFRRDVFIIASVVAAAVLVSIVAVPSGCRSRRGGKSCVRMSVRSGSSLPALLMGTFTINCWILPTTAPSFTHAH